MKHIMPLNILTKILTPPYSVGTTTFGGDSSQGSNGLLHDGTRLIVEANKTTGNATLYHVTTPGGTPTLAALTQTFSVAGGGYISLALLTIPGSGTSDIWVAYGQLGVKSDRKRVV